MRKERIVLILDTLVFGGVGLYALILPLDLASQIGFIAQNAAAVTDIRASYGGLNIGLALYFALSAASAQPKNVYRALFAAALAISGFAFARGLGLWVDSSTYAFTWILFVVEIAATLIHWVLLNLNKKRFAQVSEKLRY